MINLIRRAAKGPLAITGIVWPLILLAPYVPGLPRPTPSGLTWRQEMLSALLFSLSIGLFARTVRRLSSSYFAADRLQILLTASLSLFVLWSGASILWAANPYPALHHTFIWGAYLIFFLLMERVARRPRLLLASITVLGVVILIISAACIVGSFATYLSLFRNNGLNEPLAISIPLFAALALGVRDRRASLYSGITALAAWLVMLQTIERALLIATTASLLFMALASLHPRFRPRSLARVALLATAFAAITALQTLPLPLAHEDASASTTAPTSIARLKETSAGDLSTKARLLFWGAALEMARGHELTGIGADNFDAAFPEARARFCARHPDSSLVEVNEGFLAVRAHNEYLQILAELGSVGFTLFLSFAALLLWTAYRALRRARGTLVPGAIASMAAFAICSGATSVSFRWMGSGLMFFFAAAIVSRFAQTETRESESQASKSSVIAFAPRTVRRAALTAFAFSLVMLLAMGAQSMNVLMNGAAQESASAAQAESRFRSALFWNRYDAAAHFNYGMSLYAEGRAKEAVPHIRFAVENGINTSVCFVYLSAAEAESGDARAAEATLARALEVYPRSVFLRIRHAALLASLGRERESEGEYERALSLNDRAARGWWQLICFGKQAATQAAKGDPQNISMPGGLLPEEAVHFVIDESKRRQPNGCSAAQMALVSNALPAR